MIGVVAVIGAESSGKSTLAAALGRTLSAEVVPEQLREFARARGRPPSAQEQADVMAAQIAAEAAAAATHSRVVSDSGALMTAVYSVLYYGDDSLVPAAVAHHRTAYVATLWCDIDLPWVADPGVRDGREHRLRGHRILASLVAEHGLAVVRVSGTLDQRLATALKALAAVR